MEGEKLKLSNQALGTLMMSLQKCLLEQSDITEILKDLDFYVSSEDEIVCYNPPAVEFDDSDSEGEIIIDEDGPDDNGALPWGRGPEDPEDMEKAALQYLEGMEDFDDDTEFP